MSMYRLLGNVLAPGASRGALSVLIFHRVLERVDPLFPQEVDAAMFDRILGWVGSDFNVISLERAVDGLQHGTLPPRALAITFDDGYADNQEVALPLLVKHGMTATFFIASGFLDGGRMWNDTLIESLRRFLGERLDLSSLGLGTFETGSAVQRRDAIDRLLPQIKYLPPLTRADTVEAIASVAGVDLPDDLMMSSAQVRSLREAGMSIGAHTRSHPILASLEAAEAEDEIGGGKRDLEAILDESISLFAYPNGKPGRDYSADHVKMVKNAGFSAAVSTAPGAARADCDLFQVPRFTPWDRTRHRFGVRMLLNLRN